MSKGVSKYCSIANYLRKVDPKLYELLQELCLVKILSTSQNDRGVTFLRPDEKLLQQLIDMANSSDPDAAADVLQAMVLCDYLPNLNSFAKGIPTYLKTGLQFKEKNSNQVHLENGAVITKDSNFENRKDAKIAVYIVSEQLPPTDGGKVSMEDYAKKPVSGGADLDVGKRQVFENVVKTFCTRSTDPAMELLVALHGWATKDPAALNDPRCSNLANAIKNKASYDTLATLAIIMRPYGTSPYLPDDLFNMFKQVMYKDASFKNDMYAYSRNKNVMEDYDALAGVDSANASLKSDSRALATSMS
jgi:hypothetical protein